MTTSRTLTVTVDEDIRAALAAEAAAVDLPSEQLVGDLIRSFVEERRDARAHDGWFRREVEAGIAEANDPDLARIDDADVRANWQRQRSGLLMRLETVPR